MQQLIGFQSAFHRGMECYLAMGEGLIWLCRLSVRFSSRYGMLQFEIETRVDI